MIEPIDPVAAGAVLDAVLPMTTERLVLRAFAAADLDGVAAWQRDPATVHFLWRPMLTMEQIAERVGRRSSFAGEHPAYAIAIEHDGAIIGETVVKLTDAAARQTEIGWILDPGARGKGFATEAGAAARDLAFAIGAHRVTAILDHDNHASARVAERIGMRREAVHLDDGVHPVTGAFGSSEVWAMLEDERP